MRVRWTDPAVRDLTAICDYLEAEAGAAIAAKVARRAYDAVQSLIDFPRKGRPGRIPGTRELVIPRLPYVIFYEVEGETVLILAIRHGAQKWPPD